MLVQSSVRHSNLCYQSKTPGRSVAPGVAVTCRGNMAMCRCSVTATAVSLPVSFDLPLSDPPNE